LAPRRANSRAAARPMPLEAPVITAVFPASRNGRFIALTVLLSGIYTRSILNLGSKTPDDRT
jgi:hypothetical protein